MKIRLTAWLTTMAALFAVVGCSVTGGHNIPPASRLAEPGPGVGGPGPGVMNPGMAMGGPQMQQMAAMQASAMQQMAAMRGAPPAAPSGVMQASALQPMPGCYDGSAAGPIAAVPQSVQVLFSRPESMQVYWDVTGSSQYDTLGLTTPGRQSFQQGGIYRLKIANIDIAGYEGIELYPTLEIGPPSSRTAAYLAHSAIPIQFTPEDLNQAMSGNFVTKVIYLPDPEFQALAVAGVKTLVSTRLDPGQDPIVEAENKGAILAVIRVGNKDMETPSTGVATPSIMQAGYQAVSPAGYNASMGCADGSCGPIAAGACADGSCGAGGCLSGNCGPDMLMAGTTGMPPGGMPPGLMGAPQYGMTMSGTPIGLPGPPHIPLGVPAGLQKHVVRNWTKQHIPKPTTKMQINVKQKPGISYPKPANRAWITEETIHPSVKHSSHHFSPAPTGQIHYNCPPGVPCN